MVGAECSYEAPTSLPLSRGLSEDAHARLVVSRADLPALRASIDGARLDVHAFSAKAGPETTG